MSQPEESTNGEAPTTAAFVPPAAEELEAMLPHYGVESIIAVGGMGAVYRGVQTDLDRSVAIKLLPPEALQDEESVARFRSEARAMAKLIHPGIPAIYDFGVAHGYCYFVMEFVEGLNLHHVIRGGQLTAERALELMGQICDAVHFAHSKGIVHGDIKPANIIVDEDGRAKLTDFGLARLVEHEGENWTPMGTPEYAAPELYLRGGRSDYRADLYSIGVLLYEMLKGVPPQGQFVLPSEELGLDGRVDHIIAKCLEQNPERRFSSAQEIAQILDAIRRMPHPPSKRKVVNLPQKAGAGRRRAAVRGASAPTAPRGARAAAVRQPQKNNAPLIIGIAVVVVLALIALIALSSGGKADKQEQEKSKRSSTEPPKPDKPRETASASRAARETPAIKETPAAPAKPETASAAPAPAPAPAAGTARDSAAREKVATLRSQHAALWEAEIGSKITRRRTELAEKYTRALQAIYTEFVDKTDHGAALAAQTEAERFRRTARPASDEEISTKVERLAECQKVMRAQIQALAGEFQPAADRLREQYLVALKALETEFTTAGDDDALAIVHLEHERVLAAQPPDNLFVVKE